MSNLNRSLLTTLAALAVSPAALAGAVSDAASDFAVPSFEVRSASVYGQDLLTYDSAGNMSINLGANYLQAKQTPTESMAMGASLDVNGAGDSDTFGDSLAEDVWAGAAYQKFLGDDPRGISLIAAAGVTVQNSGAGQTGNLDGAVGAGYGRMVDARTVAQASAIYDALGRDAGAEDLARVAEVIGQRASFNIEHKADGPIEFAGALGEALGGADSGEISRAIQVLDSPIYNISSRNVGWDVGALVDFSYGDLFDEGAASAGLTQTANYGMLLDDNMGLTVSESLSRGLTEDRGTAMTVTVDAGVNLDHTSQWNSSAGVGVVMVLPEEGDSATTWGLSAVTNYAVGSTTVASAYLWAGDDTGGGDVAWNLGVNFTHFLL